MFRAFSGSCLSLEDMDTVCRPNLVARPHVLGPGVDFFTEDGEPVRPMLGAQSLQKVFSGSALDLNALNGEPHSDEEALGSPHATQSGNRALPVSTILNQLSSETEKEKARSAKSKVHVLVVGENAYISCHVFMKLLQAGYTVRVAVSDTMRLQQEVDLYGLSREAAQRLSFVEADMTNSVALRDAIRGCRYIIHCGCPIRSSQLSGKDVVAYHAEAVQALFDGIRLSGKATVKRVILTGAASSVFHITDAPPKGGKFDESCWNNVATSVTDPVPTAKIVFEKEAWRLRQMLGVELVVLIPSIPIGPSRTEETSEAMDHILSLANGPSYFPFCPNLFWNFVDVRDVAEAHVRAMEISEARDQRIIVSNECFNLADIGRMIKRRYPYLTPPTRSANTFLTMLIGATQAAEGVNLRFLWRNLGVRKTLDNRRAIQELGMHFTDMEETVAECVAQMITAGEVPPPPGGAVQQGPTGAAAAACSSGSGRGRASGTLTLVASVVCVAAALGTAAVFVSRRKRGH